MDSVEQYVPKRIPDGGWGWCVVLASFLVHVMTDGIMYTMGILLVDIREYYDASRQMVGMLAATMGLAAYGSSKWQIILHTVYLTAKVSARCCCAVLLAKITCLPKL